MRIALLHPAYPGGGRHGAGDRVRELARALSSVGEQVTVLTAHDGRRAVTEEDGVRVVSARRPPPRLTERRGYEEHLGLVPGTMWELLRGDFDLAHAFYVAAGWAAVKVRPIGGPPVVFSLDGSPSRRWLVSRRYRLAMAVAVAARADGCSVPSPAAAVAFRRYLLREAAVVGGGPDCSGYQALYRDALRHAAARG